MSPAAKCSRRQKIKAELEARQLNSQELWRLQQEMLKAGSTPCLMEAARQLLQVAHYDAVVEERSLEGLCGHPPCSEAVVEVPERKRWSVNYATREVIEAAELRKFCGPSCRKESLRFRASLQPEPIYLRPNTAVLAARKATGLDSEPEPKGYPVKEIEPLEETKEVKEIPKVRPKTLVRFSRERQSYSVHYSDYDGGGALPDVPSVKDEPLRPKQISAVRERRERQDAHRTEADVQPEHPKHPENGKVAEPPEPQDFSDSDGEGDLYDPDVVPDGKCSTPWIHVWNTLNTWMTETAKEVLRGGSLEVPKDRRPAHKGRRDLLTELLTSRLSGEFSFLATRFYEFVSSLGVHQTLPSVTEHRLYDLLAVILMLQLYRMDARRGLFELDDSHVKSLESRMKEAATAFNISEKDLEILLELVS